jgi:hypothetical protein
MKRTPTLVTTLVLALMLALVAGLSAQLPQGAAHAQDPDRGPVPQQLSAPQAQLGTSFTYQGRLTDGGSPADGEVDLRFGLYDAASGGNLLGTVTVPDLQVTAGLFTVQLDYGQVFTGTARFLEVGVRPGDSDGAYTTLTPRQELTPAPYALALPGLWTQQNTRSHNVLGGFDGNSIPDGVVGATIGGGGEAGFPNRVTANFSTVAGGVNNAAYGAFATVGGGDDNQANAHHAVIAGGYLNRANASYATVAGGSHITVTSDYATIGGGRHNDIGVESDSATIGGGGYNRIAYESWVATIGGGHSNDIGESSQAATIGGGRENDIGYGSDYATIGGGYSNDIGDGSDYATIGGGYSNDIGDGSAYATIGGGYSNEIWDGDSWVASIYATIGGGYNNLISGTASFVTIPGGSENEANGDYAFAAGRRAHANNQGCFVWGDSYDGDVECNNDNRWVARASGGVYFYTNSGLTLGSRLAANGTAWGALSTRHLKDNFAPVDTQQLLARLAEHPITTWNYKNQDPSIRHIGPMAQDFNALLPGLGGEGETYINTLDADGVALAAIQGLYAQNQELRAQVNDLEARLAALERGGVSPSSALGLPTWLLLGGLVLVGGVVLCQSLRGWPAIWRPTV